MNRDESKDSRPAGSNPAPDAAKTHAVQDANRDAADRAMPGGRAALPPGTLRPPPQQPQGEVNRDQPVGPDGNITRPSKPPQT